MLWRYEAVSVLTRAQLAGTISEQEVVDFIADLEGQEIIVDTLGMDHIMTDVRQLAATYRLTGYDAAYLELALRRNLPLATLDKELMRACKAAGGTIL